MDQCVSGHPLHLISKMQGSPVGYDLRDRVNIIQFPETPRPFSKYKSLNR
jgi:hypothetical protein